MKAQANLARIEDSSVASEAAEKFAAGKMKEAATAYRKALKSSPVDAVLLNNLAASLARLGHLEEAAQALEKAVSRAPKNVLILENLGMVLAAAKRKSDALSVFLDAAVLREGLPKDAFPPPITDVALWRMVAQGKAHWNGGKPRGSKNPLRMPPGVQISDYIIKERDALRGPE